VEAVGRGADAVAIGLVVVGVAGFTVISIVQVFCRYILNASLFWADEAVTILFAWVSFVGASAALRRGLLVAMDLCLVRLPPDLRRAANVVSLLLVMAYLTVPLVFGITLVVEGRQVPSPSMQIPMAWAYLSVLVGVALMLIQTVVLLVRTLARVELIEAVPAEEGSQW
jgi:C4-dicarboxylate transporter DctM subunit